MKIKIVNLLPVLDKALKSANIAYNVYDERALSYFNRLL